MFNAISTGIPKFKKWEEREKEKKNGLYLVLSLKLEKTEFKTSL